MPDKNNLVFILTVIASFASILSVPIAIAQTIRIRRLNIEKKLKVWTQISSIKAMMRLLEAQKTEASYGLVCEQFRDWLRRRSCWRKTSQSKPSSSGGESANSHPIGRSTRPRNCSAAHQSNKRMGSHVLMTVWRFHWVSSIRHWPTTQSQPHQPIPFGLLRSLRSIQAELKPQSPRTQPNRRAGGRTRQGSGRKRRFGVHFWTPVGLQTAGLRKVWCL